MLRDIKKSFLVWACIPAALCILALWYQFGFTLGGMIEEWDMLWMLNRFPHFWNSFPGNPMADQFAARPFQVTPFAIARSIDHDSFLGFHFLLMIACFLRVVAGASIGFFVFRSRRYALALGLLFFMFPADTQQMSFRTLNVSVAIALMTMGIALSLRAIVAPTAKQRTINVIAGGVLSCIATLTYEPVLTLYVLFPLFLFGRYGWRKSLVALRRRRAVVAIWFIAPIVSAAYLAYAVVILKSGYQVGVTHGSILKSIIENLPYLWHTGAYRAFYDAWVSIIVILRDHTAHYGFLAIVGLALLAILFLAGDRPGNEDTRARLARYVAVGLIAAIAGYLPFMVDASHMVVTQRTFMGVAPGMSLVLIAVIAFALPREKVAGTIVAAAFVFIGLVAQLYQFDSYTRSYISVMRPYMSLMADEIDPTKGVHLIRDTSGFGGYFNGMYVTKIRTGAADRTHNVSDAFALCKNQPASPLTTIANCKLDNGVWSVNAIDGLTKYPADRVQVMEFGKDFDSTYRSKRRDWHDYASFTADQSIFKPDAADLSSYSCSADSDWGYTGFCRGERWSNGMYRVSDHVNYFLAVASDPTLLFDLKPTGKNYRLSIRTLGVDPYFGKNMTISANGTPLKWTVVQDFFIEADVPSGALKGGMNEIEFENARQEDQPAGIPITKIDLRSN